jgi:vacuolar-type H+-ATPase subunit I/STV1
MPEKLSLQAILAKIDELDQAEVIDDQAAAEIREALGEKTDSYYRAIQYYETREQALKSEVDRLNTARKQLQNTVARIKEMLRFTMSSKGYKKLPGELYQASLVSRETLKIKRLPNEFDAVDYDGFVNVKLSWDLPKLKAAAKTDEEIAALFDKETTESLRFTVKKGENK